jgi:hypothetical protein
MSSSSRPTAGNIVAAGILAIALAIVVGAAALGAARQVAPSPSPSPAATPSPLPTAPATPVPATPAPTADPTDGPIAVVLDTVDENDPRVVVDDQTGTLVDVLTGHGGDGMSVRWNEAIVDQIDARTIRVTWVGFPGDEQVVLTIDTNDGAPVLVFDQRAPYANTDALGADRVLVLTFDNDVDAGEVEVAFPSVEPTY